MKCPVCKSSKIVGTKKRFKCLKCGFENNEYVEIQNKSNAKN